MLRAGGNHLASFQRSAMFVCSGVVMGAAGCAEAVSRRSGPEQLDLGVDSGAPVRPDGAWRSSLYPEDWAPGFVTENGRLRDFSHAGYGGGGVPLPVPGLEDARDVRAYGADPTGESDSTTAIQSAIDSLPDGGVLHIPEGRYRVDGTLTVTASGTVLLGDGSDRSELWFTSSDGRAHGAHLTFRGAPTAERSVPLVADVSSATDRVYVETGSGLSVGDEVWVGITITPEFISDHGMDGYWTFSLEQWRPWFRRTVVALSAEGDREAVVLDVTLPYGLQVRDDARIERVGGYLEQVGLVGLGVSNAVDWEAAWAVDQVHAVAFDGVRDAFVQDLASYASPLAPDYHLQSSGVLVRNSRRVTIADSVLGYSQNRGPGGNGYLFEVRTSNGVLVRDSTAVAGRHNFIQNWDFGASDLVFLRTHSEGAEALTSSTDPAGSLACSETHHALAIAVLVDQSTVSDCWKMVNRLTYSSGAGHTATESVFWNLQGDGALTSHQYGRGYVIGTAGVEVETEVIDIYESLGTAPEDMVEGLGEAEQLQPLSLYEDQLSRRLSR